MKASVIIPLYNGGTLYKEVLEKLLVQEYEDFEIVVVDSTSSDDSGEFTKMMAEKDSRIIYSRIQKITFQHGRTRNYGASLASGDFLVFITQDALPVDNKWLSEMIKPFSKDEQIAGVFGRHIAYENGDIYEKEALRKHFESFRDDSDGAIFSIDDYDRFASDAGYQAHLSFYSDNASAMRKTVWEKIPYPEVEFAEDQIWAKKILLAGYKKAYAHNAVVYHSHKYKFKEAMRRYADDSRAIYNMFNIALEKHVSKLPIQILRTYKADQQVFKTMKVPLLKKISLKMYSLKKNTAKISGYYIGYRKQSIIDNPEGMKRWKKGVIWLLAEGRKNIKERKKYNNSLPHNFLHIASTEKNLNPLILNEQKRIAWFVPPFSAGSGGHMNIFRTISFLEKAGYKNDIYIIGSLKGIEEYEAAAVVRETFFEIEADVYYVKYNNIDTIARYYDVTFATSWDTCYYVHGFSQTKKRAYFVQDFEPYFHPVGSTWHMAENTYKMPFDFIVTAGEWLKKKMLGYGFERVYSFGFAYDKDAYFKRERTEKAKQITFYARPETERRGFDIANVALEKIALKYPDSKIALAGSSILSHFPIPYEYIDKGVLSREECGELYANSDVVLVMSLTNLSLLPFEVAASGGTVVMNRGENNEWVDPENSYFFYCDVEAESIFNAIDHVLQNPSEVEKKHHAINAVIADITWEKENAKVVAALDIETVR
ncbi:MAG: glycosyltransferase [Culicoidibacterales bacterium]